jgi:hypothetical protein
VPSLCTAERRPGQPAPLSSLGSWPPLAFGRPSGIVREAFKGDLRK